MYKYLFILIGGIVVFLTGVYWLLSQGDEVALQVHNTPVEYNALVNCRVGDIPSYARNIYRASYMDWQVGEWAWRFDVQPGSEAALVAWAHSANPGPEEPEPKSKELWHIPTPQWWAMPQDVRQLLSRYSVDSCRSFTMWFSPFQNRVWIRYSKI